MKRKILSLALAVVMCLSLTIPALAVGKPGDTTVTDVKGNVHTLSSPILYTVTREDVQKVDRSSMKIYNEMDEEIQIRSSEREEVLDRWFWPLIDTVYVVAEDTQITLQENVFTNTLLEMDVTWGNNGGHATEFYTYNYPDFDSLKLSGYGYVMSIELISAVDVNTPASKPGGDYEGGGSESSGPKPIDNKITFYVLKKGETKNPFAAASVDSIAPSVPSTSAFTDVAANSPFASAISWAVEKGITNGATPTTFAPGSTCTRGHILTFLWRSQGSPEPTISNPYKDEIPGAFQKAAIWAYEKGLVTGDVFGSAVPCTRSSSVSYMWKLADKPTAPAASFKDVSSNSEYAKAINWAVAQGITNGTGDGSVFSPDTTCTRGQIATFLYRAYAK